jgi:hypothetical protein
VFRPAKAKQVGRPRPHAVDDRQNAAAQAFRRPGEARVKPFEIGFSGRPLWNGSAARPLRRSRDHPMRFALSVSILGIALGMQPAVAEISGGLFTAPDAILCLARDNVGTANLPAVAKSQTVLNAMGCLRTEAGIPISVIDRNHAGGPTRVRFYPAGISTGIVLWALPSSFTTAERVKFVPMKAEKDVRR